MGRPWIPLSEKLARGAKKVRGGCWEWQGGIDKDGYGKVSMGRANYRAHRVAYQLHTGVDPAGSLILHTCDNPRCVNPEHLRLGTQKDNISDMHAKGRAACCGPAGEKNSKAKLSEADVKQIRQSNLSCRVLAQKYGVHHSTIWHAKKRTWQHV